MGTNVEITDLHRDTFQCFYPWCSRMVVTLNVGLVCMHNVGLFIILMLTLFYVNSDQINLFIYL